MLGCTLLKLFRQSSLHSALPLLFLLLHSTYSDPLVEDLSSSVFDSESFGISHLAVDRSTGKLYAGAVNRLYQLSEELDLEHEVRTGPENDNAMCPPPPETCRCTLPNCKEPERTPIDSISKVLIIDYSDRQLIHCNNLFQVCIFLAVFNVKLSSCFLTIDL
jgi:hypothetical protein